MASQSAQPLPLGGMVGSTPGNVLTLAPNLAVAVADGVRWVVILGCWLTAGESLGLLALHAATIDESVGYPAEGSAAK